MATNQNQYTPQQMRQIRAAQAIASQQPQAPQPQVYDTSTTEGVVRSTRQQLEQARQPAEQFVKTYIYPERRRQAFTPRQERRQILETGREAEKQLGEVKGQQQTFEREVATKVPEYSLPEYKQQALQEAKSAIEGNLNRIDSDIQKKLDKIKYYRDKERTSDRDYSDRIDDLENDIDILRAERKGWQSGLGDDNTLIKKYFSGETKSMARYYERREQQDQRNKEQFNKFKQTEDFKKLAAELKLPSNASLSQYSQAVDKYNKDIAYKNQLLKLAEQKGGVQFLNPAQQKALGVDTGGFEYYKTPLKAWYDPSTGKELMQSIDPNVARQRGYLPIDVLAFNPQTGQSVIKSESGLLTQQQYNIQKLIEKTPSAAVFFGGDINRMQSRQMPTEFIVGGKLPELTAADKFKASALYKPESAYELAGRYKETKLPEVPSWNLLKLDPFARIAYNLEQARVGAMEKTKEGSFASRAYFTALQVPLGASKALSDLVYPIRHPIETVKGIKELIVSPEARKELFTQLGEVVTQTPAYAVGYIGGTILGSKGVKAVTGKGTTKVKETILERNIANDLKRDFKNLNLVLDKEYGLLGVTDLKKTPLGRSFMAKLDISITPQMLEKYASKRLKAQGIDFNKFNQVDKDFFLGQLKARIVSNPEAFLSDIQRKSLERAKVTFEKQRLEEAKQQALARGTQPQKLTETQKQYFLEQVRKRVEADPTKYLVPKARQLTLQRVSKLTEAQRIKQAKLAALERKQVLLKNFLTKSQKEEIALKLKRRVEADPIKYLTPLKRATVKRVKALSEQQRIKQAKLAALERKPFNPASFLTLETKREIVTKLASKVKQDPTRYLTPLQKATLKRVKKTTPKPSPKTIRIVPDRDFFEYKKAQQDARFKSGADVVEIGKTGQVQIVETVKPQPIKVINLDALLSPQKVKRAKIVRRLQMQEEVQPKKKVRARQFQSYNIGFRNDLLTIQKEVQIKKASGVVAIPFSKAAMNERYQSSLNQMLAPQVLQKQTPSVKQVEKQKQFFRSAQPSNQVFDTSLIFSQPQVPRFRQLERPVQRRPQPQKQKQVFNPLVNLRQRRPQEPKTISRKPSKRKPSRYGLLPTITQQIYRVRRKKGPARRLTGFEALRI